MRGHGARIMLAMLLATATSACSTSDNASATLDVLAASSLTDSFTELGTMFEASRRGVTVSFGFGASSALAEQIKAGAPGDVFAGADTQSMDKVVAAGRVAPGATPAAFATNRLAIVVAKDNPQAITGLADLDRRGLVVVLCAPEVPCGRLAQAALARQHVTVDPASLEQNVKAVTTKVVLGEADAGIVYETDVRAAGASVERVEVEGADDPALQATYVIARLADADTDDGDRDLADEWVAFVRSAEAEPVFARFGFGRP